MAAGKLYQFSLPPTAARKRELLDSLFDHVVEVRGNVVILDLAGPVGDLLVRMLSGLGDIAVHVEAERPQRVWDPPARGGFHDHASLKSDIRALPGTFGNLVDTQVLGRTHEGRDILSFRVKTTRPVAKRVLLVGCHHGCERISVEIPYRVGLEIAQSRAGGTSMGDLDSVELVVVPMLNPDGHEFFTINHDVYRDWRKNRAPNPPPLPPLREPHGVDLNRNYGFMWGTGDASPLPLHYLYRGTAAFSEPEPSAVRSLLKSAAFDGVLSYHSYGQKILYPLASVLPDDCTDPRIESLRLLAEAMARESGRAGQPYTVMQASTLYPFPVGGELGDWALKELDVAALTIELPSASPSPGFWLPASEINPAFAGHYPAALTFLSAIRGGWKKP